MTYSARPVRRARVEPDSRLLLHDSTFSGADFSGRKLTQLSVAGSSFANCRFDRIRAQSASLGGGTKTSRYVDCSFDDARMRMGPGGYARFERCSFRNVDLRDWFCFAVELVDCTFTGRLRKVIFNGKPREDQRAIIGRSVNEFRGNDFIGTDLVDVAFRTGIDLTAQRLPDGPPYLYMADAAAAVRRAKIAASAWDDLDRRREAMALIGALEFELAGGQRQLLLRRDDYRHGQAAVTDAVFELLGQ